MKILSLETHIGQPYVAGETKITPVSQSLRLQIPGLPGGLIWNRPVAVRVRLPVGPEETLPIWDMTRVFQLLVVGLGLLGGMFTVLAWQTTKKVK